MKTRGRPRHPEVLTPRQQDVLALVRQGLTNSEIAERLGISEDGVKYHVSDILRRLGVENRHEAALWTPDRPSRWAVLFFPFLAVKKLKLGTLGAVFGAAVIVVVGVSIALLSWGVLTSSQRQPGASLAAIDPNLIIYTTRAPGTDPGQHERWTVGAYDSAAGALRHSFEIGDGIEDAPQQVILTGDKLIANLSDRIVRYELDGSNVGELRRAQDGGRFIGIAASPDGRKLAFTEQTEGQCPTPGPDTPATVVLCQQSSAITTVRSLDLTDGSDELNIPQTASGFDGFNGQAALVTWRADGRGFVVRGYTYSEAQGGIATVMLDGAVSTFHAAAGAMLSPDGVHLATGDGSYICGLGGLYEQHEIRIESMDDGSTVARLADPVLNIVPREWSPDGNEILYHTAALANDAARPGCRNEDQASVSWFLLAADGTAPAPVSDPDDAHRRWFGDRRITYSCGSVSVLDPYCADGQGVEQAVLAYTDGHLVGSGTLFNVVRQATHSP